MLLAAGGQQQELKTSSRASCGSGRSTRPQLARQRVALPGELQVRQGTVAGLFNGWSATATPLVRQGNAWVGELAGEPGELQYKFRVDGRWLLNPTNPRTEGVGERDNSVLDVKGN